MKKVWVLEKFRTHDDLVANIEHGLEIADAVVLDKPDEAEHAQEFIAKLKQIADKHPDGMWVGWQGKTNYKQFCECAKESLRLAKPGDKFRVVEGQIKDSATTWVGYTVVKQNDGVLQYLMATK